MSIDTEPEAVLRCTSSAAVSDPVRTTKTTVTSAVYESSETLIASESVTSISTSSSSSSSSASASAHQLAAVRAQRVLTRKFVAELVGTYLLVLFGVGSVFSAVLTGALQGLWQAAVVWGIGLAMAIYLTASVSGAHLNPAVSLAMAVYGEFTGFGWSELPAYVAGQMAGAILGGATLLGIWGPFIAHFETQHGIERSVQPDCVRSAMIFGEYFPNPGVFPPLSAGGSLASPLRALCVEAFGTFVLAFVIFALTDRTNKTVPAAAVPAAIGATVAALIACFAPISQAGWNPARDLGPRIVAALSGWGSCAIPGPHGGFWVYIVGPCLGAVAAGAFYFGVVRPQPGDVSKDGKAE